MFDTMFDTLKVAIVHDYLNQFGGAERVVCELARLFPRAPIYTSIYHPDLTWPALRACDVRTSWMQHTPLSRGHFRWLLPFYPFVFGTLHLTGYDLVLSSSSSFAKAVAVDENCLHVCYCHTPPRFLWSFDEYVRRDRLAAGRPLLVPLVEWLKRWDLLASHRPDHFIANSTAVQRRIRRLYRRESQVIHPPVDVHRFRVSPVSDDYYLIVSRLLSYKRIDLAVEAFTRLNLPLVVVGEGPAEPALRAIAGPNITFTGRLSDAQVVGYFEHCRALVFPGEEDFGLTPLEASACGKPTVAFGAGGALDSIVEGLNGLFFREPTAAALAEAVQASAGCTWDPGTIRAHAERFGPAAFRRDLLAFLAQAVRQGERDRTLLETASR
jgi:glycosyltransferase involved in cell wall biosynthesis